MAYVRACVNMTKPPSFALGRLPAMANGFEISLVHCGTALAKFTTDRKYVTLAEAQRHVPSDFERGSYNITFRDEDSQLIGWENVNKSRYPCEHQQHPLIGYLVFFEFIESAFGFTQLTSR